MLGLLCCCSASARGSRSFFVETLSLLTCSWFFFSHVVSRADAVCCESSGSALVEEAEAPAGSVGAGGCLGGAAGAQASRIPLWPSTWCTRRALTLAMAWCESHTRLRPLLSPVRSPAFSPAFSQAHQARSPLHSQARSLHRVHQVSRVRSRQWLLVASQPCSLPRHRRSSRVHSLL